MILVAIILDKYVDIETNAHDLNDALTKQGATRFCFDFGFLNRDFERTNFPFALVPLDKQFKCKRTLVYGNGKRALKKIEINSKFGLFEDDFINVDVPHIEINESNYKEHGIIVSNWNNYFEIINALAKHFKIINDDNEKSFILSNSELMNFALVPFTLSSDRIHFIVDNVEDQMEYKEFDAFIETFVSDSSII